MIKQAPTAGSPGVAALVTPDVFPNEGGEQPNINGVNCTVNGCDAPLPPIIPTVGHGILMQYQNGSSSVTSPAGGFTSPNKWLKLQRVGNVFTSFYSVDGKTWVKIGSTSVSMTGPVTVGLFVTAHNVHQPSSVAFDNVQVTGASTSGTIPDPSAGGWTLNGSSKIVGNTLQLTQTTPTKQAGTSFWPTPVSSANVSATFTTTIGGGTGGGDGMTFFFANPSTPTNTVGRMGGGLGFSGISGIAVALNTFKNAVNPSNNFVGITDGPVVSTVPDQMHWLATSTTVPPLRATHTMTVTLIAGTLKVSIDGVQYLSTAVTVGPTVLLGYSGGTGTNTDIHAVSNVAITAA
jgi:hypothetical protein